jgi:uroporphyrinogen decarboxylase
MTKIERMTAAINHQEADKVPKGEICIEALFANRVLGSDYPLDYQHYERDKKVRKRLHIDFINVGDWPSDEIGQDAQGNTLFRSIYGYEFATNGVSKHITKPPLENIEDAAMYPVPDIKKVSGALVKKYRDTTDLYVMGQIGGPVSMLDEMFDMEDYMVYTMTNTTEMRILGEKIMEYEIEKAKLFIDSGAHAVLVADDIAFNSGLFLPPHIMSEIVYPFYKLAVREIKKYKDVPVIFHSDGYLMDALDTLVEAGFSGIQSIQPSAGMDIREVKRRYGKDLCLIGNIDLDEIMTFAAPEVVERVVKETIDIAAPGGGFILSTCNTLVNAIPTENALAMYETAETYGVY